MRLNVRATSASTRHSAANHRHVSDCTSLVLPYEDAPPHGAVSVRGLGALGAYSAAEPTLTMRRRRLPSRKPRTTPTVPPTLARHISDSPAGATNPPR